MSSNTGGRLNPLHEYILQTSSDLAVYPAQPVWLRVGGPGNRLLTLLSPGWPEDLQVRTAEGSVLWNPQLAQRTVTNSIPSWAENIRVRWLSGNAQIRVGQTLRPVVQGLLPSVRLSFVRLGGQPVDFDPVHGTLSEVIVTPEIALKGLHFLLGLTCDGAQAQVHATLPVTVLGAAQCTERGWEALQSTRTLTVREAAEGVYRLFLPAELGEQKVALMEGSLYSSSASKRPRPLGRLAGIGAPLVVRKAPYNCSDDLCRLADAVVDHGIVRFVEHAGKDGAFQIHLTRPIRPGEGHQVVCWSVGQRIELLGHECIEALDEGGPWCVRFAPREGADRSVVAIAYQGSWRGAEWECTLDGLGPGADSDKPMPRQTASMIRWCHLPLLQTPGPGEPSVFESFVRAHATDVLAVWLFDVGLEETGLVFDGSAESGRAAWAALRTLFDGWQPSSEQVESIINLFAQVNSAEPLRALTYYLLPFDPLLAGKLILAQLKGHGPPRSARVSAPQYARLLLRCAADLPSTASDYQVRQRQTDALGQAAQTMRVDSRSAIDPNFVKEGIADFALDILQSGALKRVKTNNNLAVALQVGSFRQYLGMRVLEEIVSLL